MDNQKLFTPLVYSLKARDGALIHYETIGDKKLPAILWCYGLVCSKSHFKYQFDYFQNKAFNIVMDYRGHHESPVPKNLKTVNTRDLALDLCEVVKKIGIKEHSVVGHSLGGNVVAQYANLQDQALINKLVFMNTPVDRPFESMFYTNLTEITIDRVYEFQKKHPWIFKRIWKSKSLFLDHLVHLLGFNYQYARFSDVEEYMDLVRTIEPEVFFALVKDLDHFDRALYRNIQKESLIIYGEKDIITPKEHAKVLNTLIPHSSLCPIKDGSHVVQMDFPGLMNDILEKFLL